MSHLDSVRCVTSPTLQGLITINTGADLPLKRPPCLFAGVSPPPFSSSEAAALGLISVISNSRNHRLHGTHPQLLQEILRSPSCSSDGPSKPLDAPPTPCKPQTMLCNLKVAEISVRFFGILLQKRGIKFLGCNSQVGASVVIIISRPTSPFFRSRGNVPIFSAGGQQQPSRLKSSQIIERP